MLCFRYELSPRSSATPEDKKRKEKEDIWTKRVGKEEHLPLLSLLPPVLPVTKRQSVHTATKRQGRKESSKLRQVIEREWNAVQTERERERE